MIGHSWDLLAVEPADVARNLTAWNKIPLDGVSLALSKEPVPGTKIGFKTIMNDPLWDRAWFKEDVDTLRQCASGSLKHNFLTSYWAPRKRLAWTDDEEWNRFAHNLEVLAWLAREGKAKGILIDPEDYPGTRQYSHVKGDLSYNETVLLARKRGAQVMRAMAGEYPDITLLSFWFLSLKTEYMANADPLKAVAAAGDLWPAFINGMLDALPPGARMVDGNEHGYRYEAERNDFYLSVFRMQNKAMVLVEPENRMKYRTQVLAGFGLYLDMYTNPPDSPWYFGELDGSRLAHMGSNFDQALDATQEYVWIYGEKMDWIEWQGIKRKKNLTWEGKLPGFTAMLSFLRDKETWTRTELKRRKSEGSLTNLLSCGNFEQRKEDFSRDFVKGNLPSGWWSWQHEKKRQGVFGVDHGKGEDGHFSLCAKGVEDGCFGTSVKTSPHRYYAVEISAQGVAPSLHAGWKLNGKWDWAIPRVDVLFNELSKQGWRKAYGIISVPEGVDELVLMLGVQQGADDYTWFDNAALYEITIP